VMDCVAAGGISAHPASAGVAIGPRTRQSRQASLVTIVISTLAARRRTLAQNGPFL
jgi:hypothetical protein